MADQSSRPALRRARPVAGLALEPLLGGARELSRRWAIALIVGGPLESLGAFPLEDMAREAPELVSAVIASLASDDELDRLLEGGRGGRSVASRVPALTGAAEPVTVIEAVEALRGVLWEALLDEFGPSAPQAGRARALTDLADRLAHVCAAIVPGALSGIAEAGRPAGVPAPQPQAPPQPEPAVAPAAPARPARRSGAVIVDEHVSAGEPPPAEPVALFEAPSLAPAPSVAEPAPVEEIQIRDERGDEGPVAWIRSIGRRLERFEHDGVPFAVLLIELRSEESQPDEKAWARIEELLSDELRAGGGAAMTRERAGRYWLVAPGTERLGAGDLAARLTRAVDSFIGSRRLGLSVAIGTAICPEDGTRAAALAAHADVGLYAARSERHLTAPAEGRPEI